MIASRTLYERMALGDAPNALWPMDSTSDRAAAGSSDALTLVGSPATATTILISDTHSARDLNGTTQYASVAGSSDVSPGDVLTLEAWIVPDVVNVTQHLFDYGAFCYNLQITSAGLVLFRKSGISDIVASTVALTAGQLYHVVVTKNGSTVKLYINGVDRTGTVTNATLSSTPAGGGLSLGADQAGAAGFFNGRVQWMAIYPTAIAASRVAQHYLAGTAPFTQMLARSDRPSVAVLIGFDSGATTEHPAFTLVTQWVREVGWDTGRRAELESVDTGSVDLLLDNRDRRFEPKYTAGAYYPKVDLGKVVHVYTAFAGIQYENARANISDWGPRWAKDHIDAVAQVRAYDAMGLANLFQLTLTSRSAELTGTRVGAVLGDLSVPATQRSVQAGQVTMSAETDLSNTQAMQHLRDSEEADGPGIVFINGNGAWTFQDRNHRVTNEPNARYTWGDVEGAELPIADITPRFDDGTLYNDIHITVAGTGSERVDTDATSVSAYGKRTLAKSLKINTNADGDALAGYYKSLYKDPKFRVPSIDAQPHKDPTLSFPAILGAEISWHVAVAFTPPGAAGERVLIESHIEGMQHRMTPDRYACTLNLSPADTTTYWTLGTVGKSELGDTTRLWV